MNGIFVNAAAGTQASASVVEEEQEKALPAEEIALARLRAQKAEKRRQRAADRAKQEAEEQREKPDRLPVAATATDRARAGLRASRDALADELQRMQSPLTTAAKQKHHEVLSSDEKSDASEAKNVRQTAKPMLRHAKQSDDDEEETGAGSSDEEEPSTTTLSQ